MFLTLFKYILRSNAKNADYHQLKLAFTNELLKSFRFNVKATGDLKTPSEPAIYVCNHISYMDIPLIVNLLPHVSFVSKIEVAGYPIIGTAAKRINTIFVKRESKDSRTQTRLAVSEALKKGMHVVVFPSGTTTMDKADYWRKGIFEVAKENNVPVISVRLDYKPLRALAYIDDDNLLMHMIQLAGMEKIEATLEVGEVFRVQDPLEDCHRVKLWSEQHMPVNSKAPGWETIPLIETN